MVMMAQVRMAITCAARTLLETSTANTVRTLALPPSVSHRGQQGCARAWSWSWSWSWSLGQPNRAYSSSAIAPRAVPDLPSTSSKSLDAELYLYDTDASASERKGVTLRPYQEECVRECLASIEAGVTRIGVSSPTGSGKTTIFTELIARLPELPNKQVAGSSSAPSLTGTRVLIIVNSIELAIQAANSVARAHPHLWVEIEQGAKYKASGLADVTVATYQTLHRSEDRLNKFDPRGLKGVVVDEAHHAAAPSYLSVLSHFDPSIGEPPPDEGAPTSSPTKGKGAGKSSTPPSAPPNTLDKPHLADRKIPILGFSATFSRHDGLALGKVFDRIVFHKDLLEMIGEKWLCPVRFTSIKADIDLSSVRVNSFSGDFQATSLAHVVNTEVVNKLVVRSWLDRAAKRRSTLAFCANIDHVQALTDTFRSAGIDARYLHGGTPPAERRALLEDFRAGVYPILVNCAILTEGADVPAIDCVLLTRPTRSRNLFSQMIGRGMRLSPGSGKENCLILDIVGNLENGLVCTPTLFGLDPDAEIEDESVESLQERATESKSSEEESEPRQGNGAIGDPSRIIYIDYDDPFQLHEAMISRGSGVIETMSSNAWVDCGGDTYVLDVPRKGFVRVERAQEGAEAAWVSHYTPTNTDADETTALSGPSSRAHYLLRQGGNPTRRGSSPYRRARHVLYADSLEAAIRGSDTYATTKILRGAGPFASLLNRRAGWRSRPASERQRALVERRLGLHKRGPGVGTQKDSARAEAGVDADSGAAKGKPTRSNPSSVPPLGGPTLPNLTQGQASMILTRLQHGAKGRWETEARAQARIDRAEEKERVRKARERVEVGPLPR